jgi:hypothetical protein
VQIWESWFYFGHEEDEGVSEIKAKINMALFGMTGRKAESVLDMLYFFIAARGQSRA